MSTDKLSQDNPFHGELQDVKDVEIAVFDAAYAHLTAKGSEVVHSLPGVTLPLENGHLSGTLEILGPEEGIAHNGEHPARLVDLRGNITAEVIYMRGAAEDKPWCWKSTGDTPEFGSHGNIFGDVWPFLANLAGLNSPSVTQGTQTEPKSGGLEWRL